MEEVRPRAAPSLGKFYPHNNNNNNQIYFWRKPNQQQQKKIRISFFFFFFVCCLLHKRKKKKALLWRRITRRRIAGVYIYIYIFFFFFALPGHNRTPCGVPAGGTTSTHTQHNLYNTGYSTSHIRSSSRYTPAPKTQHFFTVLWASSNGGM